MLALLYKQPRPTARRVMSTPRKTHLFHLSASTNGGVANVCESNGVSERGGATISVEAAMLPGGVTTERSAGVAAVCRGE